MVFRLLWACYRWVGAMLDMCAVNFLKCGAHHGAKVGCGWVGGAARPPVRHLNPMSTSEWSEMGIRITS